ncbi:MAG: LexA repressor [Chloroflexota bacterium]
MKIKLLAYGEELPERAAKILHFVRQHLVEKGYSPTRRETGAACGISSMSMVAYYVDRLVDEGYLEKVPGKRARGLTVPGMKVVLPEDWG